MGAIFTAIRYIDPERLSALICSARRLAAAHGQRDSPNPARWRGHPDKLLARGSNVAGVAHYEA
jgi:hypothetical protein